MITMKVLAKNRRASFDYELSETFSAGVVLGGAEVKSIKASHVSLKGSFITLRDNEVWLNNVHVTPYQTGGQQTPPDPTRLRKLLLHRKEINALYASKQSGKSIVPTALVLDGKLIKLEFAVGKGKKQYDKRNTIKKRDAEIEAHREIQKKIYKNA
jgi:SsrA-binding protein